MSTPRARPDWAARRARGPARAGVSAGPAPHGRQLLAALARSRAAGSVTHSVHVRQSGKGISRRAQEGRQGLRLGRPCGACGASHLKAAALRCRTRSLLNMHVALMFKDCASRETGPIKQHTDISRAGEGAGMHGAAARGRRIPRGAAAAAGWDAEPSSGCARLRARLTRGPEALCDGAVRAFRLEL